MTGFKQIKPDEDAEVFQPPKDVKVGAEIRLEKISQEGKLKAIIEKAVANGWNYPMFPGKDNLAIGIAKQLINEHLDLYVIFSHDFLKAFFGEETTETVKWSYYSAPENLPGQDGYAHIYNVVPSWQYHVKQLAITPEDERIDYLYGFI